MNSSSNAAKIKSRIKKDVPLYSNTLMLHFGVFGDSNSGRKYYIMLFYYRIFLYVFGLNMFKERERNHINRQPALPPMRIKIY